MINVKLLVLFVCIGNISECYYDYCIICASHTLCMYKNPGPGPSCKSYDKTATITKDDAETIVNKINQRRNFVALGLARNLPSAANMNKMRWSEELATSAQRWADQCDPSVRPDKKDLCRDLVDTAVGQNIATITGLSPGLSVKSFVETWFMQALDYKGNVAYYNQSEDSKTDYFTQLIWAETKLVGCGKARFSIDDRGTMVDRLVCNFAPKGNVLGKTVYTIGYPATQCREHSEKDDQFTGLCKAVPEKIQRTTAAQTESSMLRMINFPNNPVKQDIDPIGADSKNRETNQDVLNLMRHQNLRHIVPQHTRGVIHHSPPVRLPNIQALSNAPRNDDVIPRRRTTNYMQNVYGTIYNTRSPVEQYRRNNYANQESGNSYDYGNNEKRRIFSGQCSRHSKVAYNSDNGCNEVCNQEQDYCTRGRKRTEYVLTTQPRCRTTVKTEHTCNSPKQTCVVNPTATPCDYNNFNCHCLSNPPLENRRRIPGEYVYYDYFPHLSLRGGEEIKARRLMKNVDSVEITTLIPQQHDDPHTDNEYITHEIQPLGRGYQQSQRQPGHRNKNRNYQNINFPFNFVYPRERLKRQVKRQYPDTSFWKVDESGKRSQKRTLRYTTLRNKKINKFKTTIGDIGINTEPITITVSNFMKHRHDNTDKSLSFDELMHFRKNRGGELNINMRRTDNNNKDAKTVTDAVKKTTKNIPKKTNDIPTKNKKPVVIRKKISRKLPLRQGNTTSTTTTAGPTTTGPTTTQMTLIGSFSPQSACTRRITCTWTAPKITDENGNEITTQNSGGGGGGNDFPNGRTPWGYVENCTRRYTCSRLYYNRNVQASDTADAGETTVPDEDYCERRALNVKRRASYGTETTRSLNYHENFTESTIQVTPSIKDENKYNADCSCDDQERREKRSLPPCKQNKAKTKQSSSNNLYFLALRKILQLWENIKIRQKYPSRCHCNASVPMQLCSYYLFIFLCVLYVLN